LRIEEIFLLLVGCLWTLFVIWLFLTIAAIAGPPESLMMLVLYWASMLVGPFTVITGSMLSLRKITTRRGPILIAVGCLILTGFVFYNVISGMRRQPLQAPTPYGFLVVLLLVMFLSDIAAYKIFKAAFSKSE
jgi:hypothetical protein